MARLKTTKTSKTCNHAFFKLLSLSSDVKGTDILW